MLFLGSHEVASTGVSKVFNLVGGRIVCQALLQKDWTDTGETATSISEGKEKAKKWAEEN